MRKIALLWLLSSLTACSSRAVWREPRAGAQNPQAAPADVVGAAPSADPKPDEDAESPPDPGPLAALLQLAKVEHKPLVVELSTSWCKSCKGFASIILPKLDVQAKLRTVVFVQYDAERGSGIDVAERFSVSGYPTFLVIDESGDARATHVGAGADEAWFLEFLERAEPTARSEARVLEALRNAPRDPSTALDAGVWYWERGRVEEALLHFDEAIKLDPGNAKHVAEEAAWRAGVARRGQASRLRESKELLAYAKKFPTSKRAVDALVAASVGGAPSAEARKRAWDLVVDANKENPRGLNDVVYGAIAAGELTIAVRAGKAQVEKWPNDANAHDTLAEAFNARGDRKEALAEESSCLAHLRADDPMRAGYEDNRARFEKRPGEIDPSIAAMRKQVELLWKSKAALDWREIDDPEERAQGLARFAALHSRVASALQAAASDCGYLAGDLKEVYVEVALEETENAKTRVLEPSASPALKTCLAAALAKASFPKAPSAESEPTVERLTFPARAAAP